MSEEPNTTGPFEGDHPPILAASDDAAPSPSKDPESSSGVQPKVANPPVVLAVEAAPDVAADAPRKPRVLCCGDSLTAGYYGKSSHLTPYALELSSRLGVPVDEIGLSGWRADKLAHAKEKKRCMDCFGKEAPGLLVQLRRHEYTVCVIMAGTNDIAYRRTAEQILANIVALHTACHDHGVRTVALPIPESHGLLRARKNGDDGDWVAFNESLAKWAASLPDKVLFVDTTSLFPYSDDSPDWAQDGLHMSKRGYGTFGRLLSDHIRSFVLGPGEAR